MDILFLGGDKRYKYMMIDLLESSNVSQIGFDISNPKITGKNLNLLNLSDFDIVLLPISGINDNMEIKTESGPIVLSEALFENLSENTLFFTGIKTKKILELIPEDQVVSFLDNDEVKSVNDTLTIDGTIDEIRDMKNDNICILGYGNLGKQLYNRLNQAGINTFMISRPKELIFKDKVKNFYPLSSQNILEVFKISDIVINTIPCNIIPEEAFLCEHVPYILDIASFPYGINQDIVKKYKDKIKYHLYLGIPSKFAPKEASEILLKVLKGVIQTK